MFEIDPDDEQLDPKLVARREVSATTAEIMRSVVCPICDHVEKLPQSRADDYTICPRCQTRFFVDNIGNAHLTKPVAPTDWMPEESGGRRRDEWDLPDKWNMRLPIALTVIVTTFFAMFGLYLSYRWWNKIPPDLQRRVVTVGYAFADGDEGTLRRLAAEGMEEPVVAWFKQARTPDWEERYNAGDDPQVEARVLDEDQKKRHARSAIDVTLVGDSADSPPLRKQIVVGWKLDPQAGWKIDSNRLHLVAAPTPATTTGASSAK